jgi:hypothetical protein
MKRLVTFIAACLIASPSFAGITTLTGTTNGVLGQAAVASGTTPTTAATAVDAPVGTLIVVTAASHNSAVFATACGDSAGNTYTQAGTTAANGTAASIFYSVTTIDLPVAGTVNCTYNNTSQGKTVVALGFTGAAASPIDQVTNFSSASAAGAQTIGPTGTLACGSASSEVVVVNMSPNLSLAAQDATFVQSTSNTTGGPAYTLYKITSSTAAVSYSPTLNATASSYTTNLYSFKAASCATSSPKSRMLLLGVGE